MSQRKSYTTEFKEEAIRVASQSGVTVVSQNLWVHPNILYMWKGELKKYAKEAFPGHLDQYEVLVQPAAYVPLLSSLGRPQ
jgi:transposase-like protein